MAKARNKGSKRWLAEHGSDLHVRRAALDGYRSRAVYKLIEIDERDRLLFPGATVVELGAAPGGWTEYLATAVEPGGLVIASDVLPMEPVAGVRFIQGDFHEAAVEQALIDAVGEGGADLVLSDMAPNISGIAATDQARSMALAELALELSARLLQPEGGMLVKLFHGAGYDGYMQQLKARFAAVVTRKPSASRPRSREVYALARKPR